MGSAIIHNASSDKKPEQEAIKKHKATKSPTEENTGGLTYKQQLKQDAMLWAEFLYSEYKREKALLEEAQEMPTHYDKPKS